MKGIGALGIIASIMLSAMAFSAGWTYAATNNSTSMTISQSEITLQPVMDKFSGWDLIYDDYPSLDTGYLPFYIPQYGFYGLHIENDCDPDSLITAMRTDDRFNFVNPVFVDNAGQQIYMGSRLFIKFKPEYISQIESILDQHGLTPLRSLGNDGTAWLVELQGGLESDPAAMAQELHQSGTIEGASPDYLLPIEPYLTPNDEYYDAQYYLDSLDLPLAWETVTSSAPVMVAVLDDGVDKYHIDIDSSRWADGSDYVTLQYDAYYDERPPDTCDFCYHGMAVVGIMAAAINNDSLGIAGLVSGDSVTFMEQEIFNDFGDTLIRATTTMVAFAIIDAVDSGAALINISWGYYHHENECPDDFWDINFALEYAYESGVLVVCAAGDSCTSPSCNCGCPVFPACHPTTLGVGAINMNDTVYFTSQRGPQLDVVSYGSIIPTTDRMGSKGINPFNGSGDKGSDIPPCDRTDIDFYCYFDGTSAAAAQVTGIAAMVLQKKPSLIRNADYLDSLKTIIRCSCEDPYDENNNDTNRLGDELGWGRVNAMRALMVVGRGDANNDGEVNVGDISYIINYYNGGPAPVPDCLMGDANCNGLTELGDAVYIINYVYKGGPPPKAICCEF